MPDRSTHYAAQEWLDAGVPADHIPPEIFRAYVDLIPDSIVWVDTSFTILYANVAFLADFGVSWDDARGRCVLDLAAGRSRIEMQQRLERALGLTPDNPTMTMEFAGERVWLSSLFTGHFDSDGNLVAIADQARDYSEKHAARRALEASNRRLEESNRDLQDFAYIASHDLQEPLRKISAFGDRLATKYGDSLDERGLDYLARIRNASGRMQTLIDDVLTFSRVSTHGAEPEPTDLNTVAAGVLADLELAIGEAGATVDIGVLPDLAVDATQFRQLLQNLIGNAIKFRRSDIASVVTVRAEPGGPEPEHGLSVDEPGWRITVADNGIGFDEKYRDKIFTVFQRLHSRNEYSGSGVGLSVCRRIVERHGGALSAHSEEGKGSTFTIWLPAEPSATTID